MNTEQTQINGYRERLLNADTLAELQSIALEMIGHCEGFGDEFARIALLDYVSEWQSDCNKRQASALTLGQCFRAG